MTGDSVKSGQRGPFCSPIQRFTALLVIALTFFLGGKYGENRTIRYVAEPTFSVHLSGPDSLCDTITWIPIDTVRADSVQFYIRVW